MLLAVICSLLDANTTCYGMKVARGDVLQLNCVQVAAPAGDYRTLPRLDSDWSTPALLINYLVFTSPKLPALPRNLNIDVLHAQRGAVLHLCGEQIIPSLKWVRPLEMLRYTRIPRRRPPGTAVLISEREETGKLANHDREIHA